MSQLVLRFETPGDADGALDEVEACLRAVPDLETVTGRAIRQAFDEVLDGERTGRWDIDRQLEKVEKTYIGTKVEILLRADLDLDPGSLMDCQIRGHEVDIKFSLTGAWMIPLEALGHICMVVAADDWTKEFRLGLVRITEEKLRPGSNRDKKRVLNDFGRASIRWLVAKGTLPENLLLHLDREVREKILRHQGGQPRINELFRLVQGRVISREVVLSVARQRDGMKRVRDARLHLEPEGIRILGGDRLEDRRVAKEYGLPVPGAGRICELCRCE